MLLVEKLVFTNVTSWKVTGADGKVAKSSANGLVGTGSKPEEVF